MTQPHHKKNWTGYKLGNLFRIKHGYAFKGEHFSDSGNYVVLTPGNFFEQGGFRFKEKEKFYEGNIPGGYILEKDDLIIAMTEQAEGLLGSSALVPESNRYLHNQRLGLVTDIDTRALSKKFLYYLFNTHLVRDQIRATANGAKVRHTSPSRIYEVTVDLPPVKVQWKIEAILSAYDDLIEINLRRIKLLEQITHDLYQEWFVHFRFPGHNEKPGQTDLPNGWRVGAFTDFIDVLSGGTPSTKKPEYWDGAIPFFSPKDAGDFPYVITTQRYITQEGLDHCNSQLYRPNTVFITARGTVGTVRMPAVDMAMNQSCYALVGKDGISQLFVYFLTQQKVELLSQQATGAVFDTITVNNFERLSVLIPTNDLIGEFEKFVSPIFAQIHNLIVRNQYLTETRNMLLPRLISGELDVSNLDIPVSEELIAVDNGA